MSVTESTVEEASLDWHKKLGYTILHGPDINTDGDAFERKEYDQVILEERLRETIHCLNRNIPVESQEEAFRKVAVPQSSYLVENNQVLLRMLIDGVPVEYQRPDGTTAGDLVRIVDFEDPTTTTG